MSITEAVESRYQLGELIGEGASGQVYLAHDRHLGRSVALKTLRSVSAEELYRLKKEFRSLSDLTHPNVVQFYDLVVDERRCFFTMEYVRGRHFLDWVWGEAKPDGVRVLAEPARQRLQLGMAQLVRALEALHGTGRVHRDVKPGNILVTESGRLVLVDLGFSSRVDVTQSVDSQVGKLVGTIAYMAPEQAWGQRLSTAADWFSVGVILHEALTGSLPQTGSPVQLLLSRRSGSLDRPSDHPAMPDDWAKVVEELLAHAPENRPAASKLMQRFASEPPVSGARPRPAELHFVGRGVELSLLRDAFRDSQNGPIQVVHVLGKSGLGKSTLLQRFVVDMERERGALVLKARCHHNEHVPFKAIDGLVDELSRVLLKSDGSELVGLRPSDLMALLRLFPVLKRVGIFRDYTAGASGIDDTVRHSAFLALRDVLCCLAKRAGLLLWIDDLQWADHDGLNFLRLLQKSANVTGILAVYSYRSEEHEYSRAVRSFLKLAPPTDRLELGPLDLEDTRALVSNILGRDVTRDNPSVVRDLAETTRHSPLFAKTLSREFISASGLEPGVLRAPGFAELIWAKVERLADSQRLALELVCIAGRPLPEHVLARASGATEGMAALAVLRTEALVCFVPLPDAETGIETLHDGVRDVVLAHLTGERKRELHGLLGAAIAEVPNLAPHHLVEHILFSSDREQAAKYALAAADQAADLLAFERAASLYERALALLDPGFDSRSVRARWGRALASAGYGVQGAEQLSRAADELALIDPHSEQVVRWRAAAGQRFIQSGVMERGLREMQSALAAVGLRYASSATTAFLWSLLNLPRVALARLWWSFRARKKPRSQSGGETPLHLEIAWAAGVAVGAIDAIRAFEFQVRHALLAFKTGSTDHIARTLAARGVVLALEGGRDKWDASTQVLLEASRLAEHSGSADVKVQAQIFSGFSAYMMNRWHDGRSQVERARQICRDRGVGTIWDLTNANWLELMASVQLGEIERARNLLPDVLFEADERSDYYASGVYRLGWPNLTWLCADEPQEALHHFELALEPFRNAKFTTLHMLGMLALAQIRLYQGDAGTALAELERDWPKLKGSFQLRLAQIQCEMVELRGRAALSLLLQAPQGKGARQLRACVTRAVRVLAKNPAPSADPREHSLRAGLAACDGELGKAVEQLERAAVGFERLEMRLYAASARYQLDRLSPNRCDRGDAERWLRSAGVVQPRKIADLLVPGLFPAAPGSD